MLLGGHLSYEFPLTNALNLKPMLYFRNIQKASETILQAVAGYRLGTERKTTLYGGLGYRFADALQILAGVDFKKIKVMLGYDHTLSGLTKAQSPAGFGAFEVSAVYVGVVKKKPDPKPVIFCPRF